MTQVIEWNWNHALWRIPIWWSKKYGQDLVRCFCKEKKQRWVLALMARDCSQASSSSSFPIRYQENNRFCLFLVTRDTLPQLFRLLCKIIGRRETLKMHFPWWSDRGAIKLVSWQTFSRALSSRLWAKNFLETTAHKGKTLNAIFFEKFPPGCRNWRVCALISSRLTY